MLNKRILSLSPAAGKDAVKIVLLNWIALLASAGAMACLAFMIQLVYRGDYRMGALVFPSLGIAGSLAIRSLCTAASAEAAFMAGSRVKQSLRERIYRKLAALGPGYSRHVSTAETIQLSGEGVDQLESYFSRYVPQVFYSPLASLTLFVFLSCISLRVALVLLVCVPLIPITIGLVQGIAKKILGKYWTAYTRLGDSFLENLQGLTTLKIYGADGRHHRMMNEEAENFRRITMRVLRMQLNSITVMDLIAYGGAALSIILALGEFHRGFINFGEAFFIILIGAEFFIPLRLLGSYFHVAMNGAAAGAKIFRLLDLPGEPEKTAAPPAGGIIRLENLSFAWEPDRRVLQNVSLEIPGRGFIALVGESGSGKSTVAAILTGRAAPYEGRASIGGLELRDLDPKKLMKSLTLVSHNSYVFAGTLEENLLMAKPEASAEELREVLRLVKLDEFAAPPEGLKTPIAEGAANLSGGQRQRIALARALLRDTDLYIFDEASSNVDTESEETIMAAINGLARRKTVLLITHRLANARRADKIAVLEGGRLTACDTHEALMAQGGIYARMYRQQEELESFVRPGAGA